MASVAAFRGRFLAECDEKNYGQRVGKLVRLGQELAKTLPPDEIEQLFASLPREDTFSALSALGMAEGAAVASLPAQLLGHPSQVVRARAVQLLQAGDAEKAFLSEDSNQQLKTWLIKNCPTLPCNAAVLEHAKNLFGEAMAWQVLQRAPDEKLFGEWVDNLKNFWPVTDAPGLPRLAKIYPDTILRLMKSDKICIQNWVVLLAVAQQRPQELLRWSLDNNMTKLGAKKKRLLEWSWRHQHDVMVDICKAAAAKSKTTGWSAAKDLVAIQQGITTSHACPTVRRKIHTAVAVYQQLPEDQKSVAVAREFLGLLPTVKEHGSKELVEGFWQVVADLGRGKLAAIVQEGLYKTVARKLPPPVAVEQFFRLLKDVQPDQTEYHFVQSTVCKTTDGQHDDLMKKVFERFLQVDRPKPAPYVEMFQHLLKDAVTMDVIHTSFDLLTAKLSGAVERTVFRDVVSRMTALDAEVTAAAKANRKGVPAPALPLPTSWLRFVPHPAGAPPYVGFLHGALQTWAQDPAALKVATDRFGTALFWSTLGHVLAHALGGASAASVQWAKDAVDFAALAQVVAIAPVPAPTSETTTADGAALLTRVKSGAGPKRTSVYFTGLEAKKNDTFGRDVDKRMQAYNLLVREASKDPDVVAAFDDLLPFLVTRFGGEQENVQFMTISMLLPAFKLDLWSSRVEHLRGLWKVWSKARGAGGRSEWFTIGAGLVKRELHAWGDRTEPSEPCTLGLEVTAGTLNLADCFATVYKESAAASKRVSDKALEWVVRTAVPPPKRSDGLLVGEDATRQPLQDFMVLLQNIATLSGGLFPRAERSVWETWPFIKAHWEDLLGCGLSLVGAEYLLVGVVQQLAERQAGHLADPDTQNKAPLWWELLKCDAYTAAVRRVLLQIETGEIPEVQGAQMLARRSQVVQVMEWMQRKGSRQMPPAGRHDWRNLLDQTWYHEPVPAVRRKCPDADVASELGVLSGLLDKRGVSRKVLWCVVHATEGVSGEVSDKLLEKLIGLLDARREGMGRCVAQQYPYLLEVLADSDQVQYPAYGGCAGGSQNADLLTPALELWLRDTKTRDKRVAQLMGAREDAHLLLFFGSSFAEHLSMLRQECLHACMQKFHKPPEGDGLGEFYHHIERGPSLPRVAQYNKGWKNVQYVHDPSTVDTRALQTFLWHRDTQALFLEKALTSTNMGTLAIIPSLLYVEGIAYAGELLQAHPREQKGTVTEGSGSHWTVIQPTGTFQDVWTEVERRFLEIGAPGTKNSIGDREADQLLVNLGRADHADKALAILGRYASKFKRAKEALMLALPNLGPSHARRVIEEVCFAKEAGVSLQVAALKLLMDMRVPNPLQLYRVAWRDGVCHRDVAAIILKKVATSPVTDWSPHDVLDMFEIFGPTAERKRAENEGKPVPVPAGKKYPEGTYQAMSAARKENLSYIANIMLQGLWSITQWHLPFLPEIVGRLALLPGSTDEAVRALKANRNQVTEVVAAMTLLIQQGRLAALADEAVAGGQQVAAKGPTGQGLALVLARLRTWAPGATSDLVQHISTLDLKLCDPATLRAFVDEMLCWQASIAKWPRSGEERTVLKSCLQIWVKALHTAPSSGGAEGWARTLREMEREAAVRGGVVELETLVGVAVEHVRRLNLSRTEHGPWAIPTMRDFLERVWQAVARVGGLGKKRGAGSPAGASQEVQDATYVQSRLLLEYWPEIFVQGGGGAEEADRLFKKCPEESAVEMVRQVVHAVRAKFWWVHLNQSNMEFVEGAAHAAMRRLLAEGGDDLLEVLANLWPKVLFSDTKGEVLQGVLSTFGQYPNSPQCIALVEALLANSDQRTWRPALRWLAGIYPRDAMRLWPKVLTQADPKLPQTFAQATEDVAEILKVCEARGLEPPRLPVRAASVPAVLQTLATSPLPTARVAAVRALREMDLREANKEQVPLLDALRSDPHGAVAAAAGLAWSAAFGEEGPEAAAAAPMDVDPDPAAGGGDGEEGYEVPPPEEDLDADMGGLFGGEEEEPDYVDVDEEEDEDAYYAKGRGRGRGGRGARRPGRGRGSPEDW